MLELRKLPNGTVVRPDEIVGVSWNWLIAMAEDRGLDTDAIYADGGDEAIRRAYNELEVNNAQ